MKEKQTRRRTLFSSDFVAFHHDDVILENGMQAERVMLDHVGAVAVLPITVDGEAILVKQYRYAIQKNLLEIPAGKLDIKNESIEACARREMQEESGYVAEKLIKVADVYSSVGISNERIRVFVAFNATYQAQALDEGEFVDVVKVPLETLIEQAYSGTIKDAKTMLAVLHAAQLIHKKGTVK